MTSALDESKVSDGQMLRTLKALGETCQKHGCDRDAVEIYAEIPFCADHAQESRNIEVNGTAWDREEPRSGRRADE